ncbi:hypothetical protein P691DRAFT_682722, partial [Macrolepiota fuliginosa MF-IS2]
RMGEVGEPWGMPFLTDFISPLTPSRQIATSLSERKLAVHLTSSSGTHCFFSSLRSQSWFTKSKYPLMLNVSADVTNPWFHALWTSCTNVSMASEVDAFALPPN